MISVIAKVWGITTLVLAIICLLPLLGWANWFTKKVPEALHPKATVESGVMAEESKALLKEFFKSRR